MDRIGVSDIQQHVITFGIDTFPQIDIAPERTRLNMFYEEVAARWPDSYKSLEVSDTEFKIKGAFAPRGPAKPSMMIDTLVITPRGPVFVFPLRLQNPVNDTELPKGPELVKRFTEVRKLFFAALGAGSTTQMMRVGMVRDLIFATSASTVEILCKTTAFAGAELKGGFSRLQYKDERHNANIVVEPVELMQMRQFPGSPPIQKHTGYGLHVQLDVNNIEMRALDDGAIADVLERAEALWPDELLGFVNGLGDKQ